jgi:hypothetical protein
METGRWEEPVTFETGKLGQYRAISSAAEACRVLDEAWPVSDGIHYIRAKAVCLTAASGGIDPEVSRNAFLKAAEEAHVFIRS